MSCECDHAVCCGLLSASDTASASLLELYRRPNRPRFHRHFGRRRLLHQHKSCPNNFIRSDEVTTTSTDELSAWTSRRARPDLPPLGAARYKTERSRHNLRPPRVCPLPVTRRGSSRHRRTTTILHHPCCLVDPNMCPIMKGSHHQQRLRAEDIDSDTMRDMEKMRAELESYLYQQQRYKPQKAPGQPEATTQIPRAVPQHHSKQMKSAQQSDPREKKCKMCGSTQHFAESTAQYAQSYPRQGPVGQPFAPADMLTPEVSSETADRLVAELSRRSAGPRATHTPQRVSMGDVTGQQRNSPSAATTNVFGASATAGLRKGEAGMMTNFKIPDFALNPPLADLQKGPITIQNMPQPRSTATSPFVEEYYPRRPSHIIEHGSELRSPAPFKTGPPITQFDVDTSYTMRGIASARAATTRNEDNESTQCYVPGGPYSYEKVASQPEKMTINFQETTRRSASEGAKPSVEVMFAPPPRKGVFMYGDQDPEGSRNQVGRVEAELRIMPQSEPDSARFTAGTFETDATELQQTRNLTEAAGTSSSNGDYQSGNQTPAESGDEGSSSHMDGEEKVLKSSRQVSGSEAAEVNGVHLRTKNVSSPGPSVSRSSGVGNVNHLPGCQRASSEASPSSRKSLVSPTTHRGDSNHQEADVRKSGNTSHNSLNVAGGDISADATRHSYMEGVSGPDDCGSCTYRGNVEQGSNQQDSARSVTRGGTPTAGSGCKSTPHAEDKVIASSRATSCSGSTAAATKTARRRNKDRGDGDAKGVSSESNNVNHLRSVDDHLSEVTRSTSFHSDDCGGCTYRSDVEQDSNQQESARSVTRGGTPIAESGCNSTPHAEDEVIASSRATSCSSSTAASTKTSRRRNKDKGDGDAKGVSSESNNVNHFLAVGGHLSLMEQVDTTRKKLMDYIDKMYAIITDLSGTGSQPKLQSADQLMGRRKSTMSEHGDSSDLEPQRESSSVELSSELWPHVDTTVRDSLASLPRQRPSKETVASSGEDYDNRQLLEKLRRDLVKNTITNLKRLDNIESLLRRNNGEGPNVLPNK